MWTSREAENRMLGTTSLSKDDQLARKSMLYEGILKHATILTTHRVTFESVTIDNLEFLGADEKYSTYWSRIQRQQR